MALIDSNYKRHKKNSTGVCKFRGNIECDSYSICEICGWNPAVEEERKKKLRKKARRAS